MTDEMALKAKSETTRQEWLLRGVALLSLLVLVTAALLFRQRLSDAASFVEGFGYVAVFLITFFASASIVLPVPGLAGVFVAGGLLNPLLVSLVAGTGFALGEVSGYLLGFTGTGVVEKVRFYPRVKEWVRQRGWLVVLVAALLPNPFFDVVGIAAGGLRMAIWRFLLFTWIGKTIKSLVFAYGGYYGLSHLLEFL